LNWQTGDGSRIPHDHLRWYLDASYAVANTSSEMSQLEIAFEWAQRALNIKENKAPLEINGLLKEALIEAGKE